MQVYSAAGGMQVYSAAGGVQVYSVTTCTPPATEYTCIASTIRGPKRTRSVRKSRSASKRSALVDILNCNSSRL